MRASARRVDELVAEDWPEHHARFSVDRGAREQRVERRHDDQLIRARIISFCSLLSRYAASNPTLLVDLPSERVDKEYRRVDVAHDQHPSLHRLFGRPDMSMDGSEILDQYASSGDGLDALRDDCSYPSVVVSRHDGERIIPLEKTVQKRRNLPVLTVAHRGDSVLDIPEDQEMVPVGRKLLDFGKHLRRL